MLVEEATGVLYSVQCTVYSVQKAGVEATGVLYRQQEYRGNRSSTSTDSRCRSNRSTFSRS